MKAPSALLLCLLAWPQEKDPGLRATLPQDATVEDEDIVFSADGRTVAYRARQGEKWTVGVNGKPGLEFDYALGPVLSPQGVVAFAALDGNKWHVVVGDEKGPEFDEAGEPVFSPDGKSVAYAARERRKAFVVVGGVRGDPYDEVWRPVWRADGKASAHAAYQGRQGSMRMYFHAPDGRGPEQKVVWSPVFAPAGASVGHLAFDRKCLAVVDGKTVGEYDEIDDLAFSADGRTVAYRAMQGGKAFVVIGDVKGPEFEEVGRPVFNPRGLVAYRAREGKRSFVVVDGKPGEAFDAVGHPAFAPDGRSVAYKAKKGGRAFVVNGDRKGREFEDGSLSTPVFSSDGTTVAYAGRSRGRSFIVAGDRKGPEFDQVWTPAFAADGKTVGYGARKGVQLRWETLDTVGDEKSSSSSRTELSPPATIREIRDIAYVEDGDPKHRLNLFLPETDSPYPVVLWIHGGKWSSGDRNQYTPLGRALAERGVGCAVMSYRLSPAVKHPAHIEDSARAFAWLRKNIKSHGGDPERLFVCGHSAGGHLAALLALDRKYLKALDVPHEAIKGAIPMSGVYAIPDLGGAVKMFSEAFGTDGDVLRDASPVTHVKGCTTPMLVITETNDSHFVRPFMGQLKKAVEKEGVKDVRFVDARNRDHYTIVMKMIDRTDDPVRDEILRFIRTRSRELDRK